MKVTGGFLSGTQVTFVDGLNCLIGGRGTGKTTAFEFLRFGLGLMPDPKSHGTRHRELESLIKANLGGGRVSIELQTMAGMRYVAGRGNQETVQVINEAGQAVPVSLDRDQVFSADVFSQNEIEDIAADPAAQLSLLDRFQAEQSSAIKRELEELSRQLELSSGDLHRLDREIDDLQGKASEVSVIEEKLKGLAEVGGPDADKLNAAHEGRVLRDAEARIPTTLTLAVETLTKSVRAAIAEFRSTAGVRLGGATTKIQNRDLVDALGTAINSFGKELQLIEASIVAAEQTVIKAIEQQGVMLAERHAVQEASYRELIAESEEQGGRSAERITLQAALAAAQNAANDQLAKTARRRDLLKDRGDLLKRLSELRDARFELRKRVADALSLQLPSIRVTIEQGAGTYTYREVLADELKGAGLKQGIMADRLVQALLPVELAGIVASKDRDALERRTSIDGERASRIIEALRSSGGGYRVEVVDIEDKPLIELRDGANYKESSKLSTGQRCTTILPILMLQSERPLLIDQPEDNLDNGFVYETVVSALRVIKGNRQVIFVTHNPNIPVLGNADKVFVFTSDGQHARIAREGTVDDCKEDIEKILEGGREAFLQRKTRYGH